MRDELNKISDAETWKYMVCDGYRIDFYSIPFTRGEKKLFEVKDRKFMTIGDRLLSPDAKRIAFTLETYKSIGHQDLISRDLYIINSDNANLVKVPVESFKDIFLITFLGNDKLLFENSEKENYLTKPGTSIIYTLDLNTNEIEEFSNQEINLNFSTVSSNGKLLVSLARDGFIVYDVINKSSKKMNINGDRPVISPDGKLILFRRGGMTGSYHLINVDGSDETIVLSREKIQGLLQDSGSYRDLNFSTWSPDSKFILLLESSDLQKNRALVLNIETKEVLQVSGN